MQMRGYFRQVMLAGQPRSYWLRTHRRVSLGLRDAYMKGRMSTPQDERRWCLANLLLPSFGWPLRDSEFPPGAFS
jgi:hypothetical protein